MWLFLGLEINHYNIIIIYPPKQKCGLVKMHTLFHTMFHLINFTIFISIIRFTQRDSKHRYTISCILISELSSAFKNISNINILSEFGIKLEQCTKTCMAVWRNSNNWVDVKHLNIFIELISLLSPLHIILIILK